MAGVNAGLAYGHFVESEDCYRHPVYPLYVIGRYFARNIATGDASGGVVQMSICPPNLPQGYLQDFFFTCYQLYLSAPTGAGDTHRVDGYSDDWEGATNQQCCAEFTGVDGLTDNEPDPTSIPAWLSWLLRRVVDPGGNQLGSIRVTWKTNVNAGAYVMNASGLVLQRKILLPDFCLKRIE